MTQPTDRPVECGPACTEQHTYRLDECALCTANLHGGYASPSWTVACPRCHTPADRPCLRRDGTASSVDCQERWSAYNAAQQQPEPVQPTDRPGINHRPLTWKDHLVARDIHTYFGLSYANYLVIPRALLQSMPAEWQEQFTGLLAGLDDTFEGVPQAEAYDVTAGKYIQLEDMTDSQLHAAGVSVEGDGPYGATSQTRYHRVRDGQEMTGDDYGFVPGVDPVPHYNRGRTRVQPTAGKVVPA